MKRKNKHLELIILLIIVISGIVIYMFYYKESNKTYDYSESNNVPNFSKNRYFRYSKNLYDYYLVYSMPTTEKIDFNRSKYDYYFISTDGVITSIQENIDIRYAELDETEINTIINYCNSYDTIESQYKLKCEFNRLDRLNLTNNYYVSRIYENPLKTKRFEIELDVNNKTLLKNYLQSLDEQEIIYEEVEEIK